MLKKHSEFFKSVLFLSDLVLISITWIGSYYLRFYTPFVSVTKGVPLLTPYLVLLVLILPIWSLSFKAFNLYRPRRIGSRIGEVFDVAKACSLSVLLLVSLTFFFRQYEFSRLVFLYFWGLSTITLTLSRWTFRGIFRHFRRKGYNLRHALIVGAGQLGQEVARRIHQHPETGLRVKGYLTHRPEKTGKRYQDAEVLGTYRDLPKVLESHPVDQIIIAIPLEGQGHLKTILADIGDGLYDIQIVPDLVQFRTLRGGVELFDGLPIITLQDSPFYGWNRILKRSIDIIVGAVVLAGMIPFMGIVGLMIRMSSGGPVFYQQVRMGLDGRKFNLLKFRTMQLDAEKETGAVWAQKDDSRTTKLGAFLRRTSLDELPQFINVLKGEMSIVGPRPERPEFVQHFRKTVPKYMLRHKVKAGITGLAQINGWRGNTSIEERIKYDLEYIENWSLALDFKIMWMTIWKGLISKNAY